MILTYGEHESFYLSFYIDASRNILIKGYRKQFRFDVHNFMNNVTFGSQLKVLPDFVELRAFCFFHDDILYFDRVLGVSTPGKNFWNW